MSRFSQVIAGTRARAEATIPFAGATFDAATGRWNRTIDRLHLRALSGAERSDVVEKARVFAKERGVDEPEDGDPLYEMGKWLHTLAIACIDRESPPDNPQPYFDGGWEQIHSSDALTSETIAHLYLQQELQQDAVNPVAKAMSTEEFKAAAIAVAAGDITRFVAQRPGAQWAFVRMLAVRCVAEMRAKEKQDGTA